MERITVLIVEDEELIRKELEVTTPWERFNCTLIGSASNGIEGARLIEELRPDIILTDIRMPGQDGLQMLRKVPFCSAIILTGHSEFSYAREAIKLGVTDYILKPIDDRELYTSIQELADKIRCERNPSLLQTDLFSAPATDKQEFYVTKALKLIQKDFGDDLSLSLTAQHVGISENYLARLFRKKTGFSFIEYLREYRIKKAVEFLKDQNLRIGEVATLTGFRDASYFSSVFHRYVGVTPKEYQNGAIGSSRGQES